MLYYNILLLNPLETFKSFTYDWSFIEILGPANQLAVEFSLFTNIFHHERIFFWTSIIFFSFIMLLVFIFYKTVTKYFIDDKDSFNTIYISLLILVIFKFFFSFYVIKFNIAKEIIDDTTSLFITNNKSSGDVTGFLTVKFWNTVTTWWTHKEIITVTFFSVIRFLFIKEFISFFSLLFIWWILVDHFYNNYVLISTTTIEMFGEFVYKKNLLLFSDILRLKYIKEVKFHQEHFFKMIGIFLFILIANLQGMVPYLNTITSGLYNTFFIAVTIAFGITLLIIKEKGLNYWFSLFLPHGCPFLLIFLLNPIEIISYSFRALSLSVRLFANMMAGHTLLKVIVGFSWSLILLGDYYVLVHYLPFGVLFLLTFLELMVSMIQAYIFVVLVYIYISDLFGGH